MAPLSMNSYRLLGRSGLRISPLCLGTMTFGTGPGWEWGANEADARRIFDIFIDAGGNFIDAANIYVGGVAEELLGQFALHKRHRLVIASKYSLTVTPDDPNSAGNQRKNMMRTVEESLRRLNTDYLDLLYLHSWDSRTPVDEILRGMDDLVRSGKVVYLGISNTPAWQVSRMQAIADLRGWASLIAFQIQYSLIERTVERDMIPMAREMGLGVIPWGALGSGVLTGKYKQSDLASDQSEATGTRKAMAKMIGMMTERSLLIADTVRQVAAEIGKTSAQVALAWTLSNPAVAAPIIGARTPDQLLDNLGALDVRFDDNQLDRLDECSAIPLGNPHDQLALPATQQLMLGTNHIEPRP